MSRRSGGRVVISIILFALFLTTIAWTAGERKQLTILEGAVRNSLAPLQSAVMRASNSVGGFFTAVFNLGTVMQEREQLSKQVVQLQARVRELEEQEYENIRLRRALNFQVQNEKQYSLELANVVAADERNWFETITINRGSADGVAQGMPVVTSAGLVGHVTAVSNNTATVLLVLDNRSAVGALVQINRTLGIIEGTSNSNDHLRMIHLPKEAPIRINQVVITSGLGGIFPKGLPIGKIVSIGMESNGLLKYAEVKPFTDFTHLEEVFVVKGVMPVEVPQAGKEGE